MSFIAFTKKEFVESLRTYRLIVLIGVLLFFGILSPLTALFLPEIIGSLDMGDGVTLTLPEPSAMDSWTQFFSNVGQMGMLALIITFSGIMANEISRGTLVNLLTKGMKRHTVVISKFLYANAMWTVGYGLCLAVCYAYTEFYWPAADLSNAFLAFSSLWLYGVLMISMLVFGGVLFGSFYGSLLFSLGMIIVMALLNIAPALHKFNPISLAGGTLELLSAHKEAADFSPAMIICTVAVVLMLVGSIVIFNRKKM